MYLITILDVFFPQNPFGFSNRMPLSRELEDKISQDFKQIFEARYGEDWRNYLSKPLKPSPIQQIAQQYGVSVSEVRRIRNQWIVVGEILTFYDLIN